MTEQEEKFLKDKKVEICNYLSNYQFTEKDKALFKSAPLVESYITHAVSNPSEHCLTELCAIKRFFGHLNRPDVHFDESEYASIVRTHSGVPQDSEDGRKKFQPTPCQAFQYASLYGLRLDDNSRLYQCAYIVIPRKYAKTSQVGIICIHELLHGPANGQIAFACNSEKQAKATFGVFKQQLDSLDPNHNVFKTGKSEATFAPSYPNRTDSRAFAVATNAKTLEGLHCSVVVCDEFSQADDTETRQVLTSSMEGRKNPLTIIITTLSNNLNGPFFIEYQSLTDLLYEKKNDEYTHPLFIHIFTPDPEDNLKEPATWKKVHPHFGVTVSENDYWRNLQEADVLGGSAVTSFYTRMCNTWCVESGEEWVSYKNINDVVTPFTIKDIESTPGLQTVLSVDLSEDDDFSSIGIMAFSPATKKKYYLNEYFFPAGKIDKHPNAPMYRRWVESGHLNLIDGDFIDQSVIANRIAELAEMLNPITIYYDQFQAKELKSILVSSGFGGLLRCCKQVHAETTAPIKYLKKNILTRKAVFSGNPIDAFCFSNVVLNVEPLHGNVLMTKRGNNTGSTNPNKIDGAVTSMMCTKAFFDDLIEI